MGRRFHTLIVTTMAVVGLGLAGPTVVAGLDDPPPATADPGRPLDLPPGPAEARPKPKPAPKAKPKTAPAAPTPDAVLAEPPEDFAGPGAGAASPSIPFKKPEAAPEPGPPVDAPPPAPAIAAPPGFGEPAPAPPAAPAVGARDPAVERSQGAGAHKAPKPAPAADGSQLPPAADRPGQPAAPAAAKGGPKEPEPSFVLPPEHLPLGRQTIGLTVEVVAPQFLNMNQTAHLKVVVKNTGTTDALGVVVRDELPPNLEFVSSQPESNRIDSLLTWNLGTVAAGAERVLTLNVKPTRIGAFDHAATVTMMAGGRSRSLVREPKLKVEQTVSPAKALKGQPVQFTIAVSNPGDGPARKVLVQAKLTPGLKHESGEPNEQNLFEQTIDLIGPGERKTLETLVTDTVLGGEQSCQVVVRSPDVVAGSPEASSTQTVNVVEPRLKLKVSGPRDRYTDTVATYDITLENPGSAPARNVKVLATVPAGGRLFATPEGASYSRETRKLTWTRPQLDPGEKAVLTFEVRMGGVGQYQVAAQARAEGPLQDQDTFATDVTGLADVDFDVSEKRRVVDVNGVTTYAIKVVNNGTKEATRLLVSAVLSDNVEALEISGTETDGKLNKAEHKAIFPPIERLGPGKSMELGIKVRATKAGSATCRVSVLHDELTEKLDKMAAFRVMATRR